jgi:hypothetical protein
MRAKRRDHLDRGLGVSDGEEELRLWRAERVEQLAGIVERANGT